ESVPRGRDHVSLYNVGGEIRSRKVLAKPYQELVRTDRKFALAPSGKPGTDRLPLYVWYVRRRSRDVRPKVARRWLGRFRLAYLPGGGNAARVGRRVGRELLLSFEIGGENSGRLTARGVVLT